jgi:hypothetical protein
MNIFFSILSLFPMKKSGGKKKWKSNSALQYNFSLSSVGTACCTDEMKGKK